jgi:signal peptidase I
MNFQDMEMAAQGPITPVCARPRIGQAATIDIYKVIRSTLWLAAQLTKLLIQCALVAALAYGSYAFFSKNVLRAVQVVGVSMYPTLRNTGHYVMEHWTYMLRDPQPDDIVVLRDPSDSGLAVKRIIGRGGDSILLENGNIYINGRLLDEPYLPEGTRTYAPTSRKGEQWVVCGENQFFVLGDNRNNSIDSRYYGPVSRQNILGMVLR